MKSLLRLFKAVEIKESNKINADDYKDLMKQTLNRGFIFSKKVLENHTNTNLLELILLIDQIYGIDGKQLNSAFHKSWKKVKESDIKTLVLEQMLHYITTYGFEELGIYNENTVYIPTEKLKIPKIDEDKILLTIINGYMHLFV